MFSIILSCVTEVRHLRSRGFGNCGVFLAHNYVSEQFGIYVEYGIPSNDSAILLSTCLPNKSERARFRTNLQLELPFSVK